MADVISDGTAFTNVWASRPGSWRQDSR